MGQFINSPENTGVPYEKDGKLFVNVITRTALTGVKGKPYSVTPVNTAGSVEFEAVAPATLAVLAYIGCPQKDDYQANEVVPLQVGGEGYMLIDGTANVDIGDYVEVINAGVAGIEDGTTRSVNSVAMAMEAHTTTVVTLKLVKFLGVPAQIAAA